MKGKGKGKLRKDKGFEIAVRVREGGSQTAWYKVKIPTKKLNPLRECDCRKYIPHNHRYGDPSRFFSDRHIGCLFKSSEDKPHRRCAVVDNTLFTFSADGIFMHSTLQCSDSLSGSGSGSGRIWGSAENFLQWKPVPSCPSNLFIWNTPYPVSMRGLVYIFGARLGHDAPDLGVIYNPVRQSWTRILCEHGNKYDNHKWTFVCSLGESVGKIMVGDHSSLFVHDVVKRDLSALSISMHHSLENFQRTPPAVAEEDSTVYWIDEYNGWVYALNWKTMELASGPIVGLEHEPFISCFPAIYEYNPKVPLLHLKDDLFCLLWYQLGEMGSTKVLHCLITRAVKDGYGHIYMSVVGCFCGTTPKCIELVDAYLL